MVNPARNSTRVRIDFIDSNGAKYSINIDTPSKDNLGKILDLAQSISPTDTYTASQPHDETNFTRLYELIETRFTFGSFTSKDVLEAYRREFGLQPSLATISTYLARLASRGVLERRRSGPEWIYKLRNQEATRREFEPGSTLIPR